MSDCETWALDDDFNEIPGTGMRWEGPERCEEEYVFGGQCIREWGHEGRCVCYDQYGSYCYWNGDEEFCGSVPAGHKDYVHPTDVETYISLGEWLPIRDSEAADGMLE